MNVYTSDAVDFFTLVLTSGIVAAIVLAIASVIAFTLAYAVFRERSPVAIPGVSAVRASSEPEARSMAPMMQPRRSLEPVGG